MKIILRLKWRKKLKEIEGGRTGEIILKINSKKLPDSLDVLVLIAHTYIIFTINYIITKVFSTVFIIFMMIIIIMDLTKSFYIMNDGIRSGSTFFTWAEIKSFNIEEGELPFHKEFFLTIKYIANNKKEIEYRLNIKESKEKVNEIEKVLHKYIRTK